MHKNLTPSALFDDLKPAFIAISDQIWGMPELRYHETQAVALQAAEMEARGFCVTRNLTGIPTAFMAEAGEGGPVIAILGEFDALAGLSQQAGVARKEPLEAGGNGHGCGHNLLGAGAMLAAVALRDYLAAKGLPGRVRYYGCPAEEGGSGKTFMARDGAFDGVDAAFCWHPGTFDGVIPPSSLANMQAYFRFSGRAAHAAASPELGRSALDALELMSVGIQYMREHMPEKARVHSALINGGGISPNVVQDRAEALYLIRAPELAEVQALYARVQKIAQGAAMMTETTVEVELDKACSNLLPNSVLDGLMQAQLETLADADFDAEDRSFAQAIQSTLSPADIAAGYKMFGAPMPDAPAALADAVLPLPTANQMLPGSTDVGDVSWLVPLSQCYGACFAIGTPFHSWQLVAQGKSGMAHRGMVLAAKAMARAGAALIEEPALLEKAKAEFRQRTSRTPYRCPIASSVKRPFERPRAGV